MFTKFTDSKTVLFNMRMSNLFLETYENRYFSSLYSRLYQFMAFLVRGGPSFRAETVGMITTSTPSSRYFSTYRFSEKKPAVKRNLSLSPCRMRLYMHICDPPTVPSFDVSQTKMLFFP